VQRAFRPLSAPVAHALRTQLAALPPCEARAKSLQSLSSGAAAVVTGQQAGLFLGPLYTVYKAATAIRCARQLSQETGKPVVPIFWLQTEDHDLPEISVTHVPRLHGGFLKLEVPVPDHNRIPVDGCVLPAEVEDRLAALTAELQTLPHAQEHVALLARHYRPGAPWAQAFAQILAELFQGTGLLFLNPRDPALAALAAPLHEKALSQASLLGQKLAERASVLKARGFDPPVHIRPDSPLSFFHPEGPTGPRFRLSHEGNGFKEIGGQATHSLETLLRRCRENPSCFSTSALLRPLFQDVLLPTAAYVGGPGEVAYFAQLQPLYSAFDMTMPLVIPRARFRVLEPWAVRALERLKLQTKDLLKPDAELAAAMDPHGGLSPDALEREITSQLQQVLETARVRSAASSLGLEKAFDKTQKSMFWAAARLRRNHERALLRRDEARALDLRRLKSYLYPDGVPQERIFGISWFAARWGGRAFINKVLEAAVPYEHDEKELTL